MNADIKDEVQKPIDWPVNQREASLSSIFEATEEFIKNPNYKNKEVLISLITLSDLNEIDSRGMYRITDYEIIMINSLYFYAAHLCFNSLKVYLYKRIAETAQSHKMVYQMMQRYGNQTISININEYERLYPSLLLFYIAYANFNLEKTRSFPDQIIHEVNLMTLEINQLDPKSKEKSIFNLAKTLTALLNDLSSNLSTKTFSILKWEKNELEKFFLLQAKLIAESRQNPLNRPLRGVLCTSISNWILKSRNNYNEDYL